MQPSSQITSTFLDFTSSYISDLGAKYGFEYIPEEISNGQKSSLYNNEQTNTREIHKLKMTVDDLSCEYYTAEYTDVMVTKYGKRGVSRSPYQVQVFEVSLPYEVEDLYISSRTNVTLTNILGLSNVSFNNAKEVTLEGGFERFFKVYTPESEELTAFTILAPNIMQSLLNNAGDFDVEFAGNKVYFYQTFKYYTAGVITLKKEAYDNLMQFGITSAKTMARAGRPAKRIASLANTPMWKLYGQWSMSKTLGVVKIFLGFFLICICITNPLLWPIFALFVMWFILRWRFLLSKRKRLLVENLY